MRAVFAADASRANQLEVSLIGQSGRLQRVAGRAASQVPPRDSPHLGVNQCHQAVERPFVASPQAAINPLMSPERSTAMAVPNLP